MNGTVLFWEFLTWEKGKTHPMDIPIAVKRVAEELEVSVTDIYDAFISFSARGFPGQYTHEVEPKKLIVIDYDPEVYKLDGILRTERPWGKGRRHLSRNIFFSIEPITV